MTGHAAIKGPWGAEEIEHYLREQVMPMRLSCVGSDGYPRVVSVWFLYRDGQLRCVSHQGSSLVALISQNPRVGFEVAPNEPPYFGVRGQGKAAFGPMQSADDTLDDLLQRYLSGSANRLSRWLVSRRAEEVRIDIQPLRWFSWDYRDRMADIPAVENPSA